ncbi:MAG: SgcJ/EcaC family oxidoreductase [Bauldia sp.]
MSDDVAAVRRAVDQWFVALNAMLAGDPKPFAGVSSHAADTFYMSGEGTYRIGREAAWADCQAQATKSHGGHVVGEDIHIVVSGEIAAVGLVARPRIVAPDGSTKDVRVRQSSVFRKEDGAWKMIAHHADNIPLWDAVVGTT